MNWIEILLVTGAFVGFVSMGVLVARSPSFWISLGVTAIKAMLPTILKAIAPKDLTKEQKDKIARGEEPGLAGQSARKFGRGKGE